MRIERIRVEGFGSLSGVDMEWPEGRLLLVVDPNESGKTTFCEAIVTALYGLPRGRVGAARARELRRPRSGAPLRVGLDLVADGRRWAVDRDLELGTLRVVDRDRGVDVTKDFLRGGGRDVFGDEVTGLTEPLFRSTAYVGQSILDDDELDSTLTVELARIADSGGGEASVVRALRVLTDARAKMPDAATGSVSVETEILRLTRQVESKRTEMERLAEARAMAAEAAARRARLERDRVAKERALALAEVGVVETERRGLRARLAELAARESVRGLLESEVRTLGEETRLLTPEALADIDRMLKERGRRPESLVAARTALDADSRAADEEDRERRRRYGDATALAPEERDHLRALLVDVIESGEESVVAEEALEAQWEELRKEGLAEDLSRLDGLPSADRQFLLSAEEERSRMELAGVQCDRRAADALAQAGIAAGERRERVKRAKALVFLAAPLLVASVALLAFKAVATPIGIGATVFSAVLALFGGFAWGRGANHRREDEASLREEEAANRREATRVRKSLSDLRLRLDRLAKAAGFSDATSLLKAHRRARAAEEKRRRLVEREARRDAVAERRRALDQDLGPFRRAIECPAGLPSAEDARRFLAILEDLERALRSAEARRAVRESEAERLASENGSLEDLERSLKSVLEKTGISGRLPLPEALLALEVGRKRLARRREILEIELPARTEGERPGEREELEARLVELSTDVERRLAAAGAALHEVHVASTPEEARRIAEASRAAAREVAEVAVAVERELAEKAREGGTRAREVEEELLTGEALLERARLFREGLDLAHQALSTAASAAYGDFKKGLAEASRAILGSWDVPYESLEFADDLSVSAVSRGGRLATKAEIAAALSTGAREQLHLVARLAALRYLGTGARGVPLLLDDPLVGADDPRFVSVMRFLVQQVLLERPVLLVSCHGWRHERLFDLLPETLRGRIASASLAGPGSIDAGVSPE